MRRALQGWRLFSLLALALSVVNCVSLASDDFRTARGTVPAIVLAVRCALPLFVVAFTASSLCALWPGRVTRWLLSNRRYIGLSFAFGMGWHFAFVGYSIATFGNGLNRFVTTLDVIGLSFLAALTLTSFRPLARHLSPRGWRRLHKAGVYIIWLLATYIYAEAVRWGPDTYEAVAFAMLLVAWALRAAARLRLRARGNALAEGSGRSAST